MGVENLNHGQTVTVAKTQWWTKLPITYRFYVKSILAKLHVFTL